ncbi:MAG: hypothetical protein ACI8ZX_000302 [Planctomycetota bacterium]|jgi:hypothetical protein
MELLFTIANMVVLPAWVLLAFFPNATVTNKLVKSYAWHIALAILYTVFIFWGMQENASAEGAGMGSLEQLRIGFLNDKILLAAWVHYLVFDLFVGVWIVNESEKLSLNKWLVMPMLFLTLMLGPVGFLLFHVYKKLKSN